MYVITTPNGKTELNTKPAADAYTDALNTLKIDYVIRYRKEPDSDQATRPERKETRK